MNKNNTNFGKRVLYGGQSYYHCWYLSRELRKIGWRADVLNFDTNEKSQMFYHGEDYRFYYRDNNDTLAHLHFFVKSLVSYEIFHFSNAWGLYFLRELDDVSPKDYSSWQYKILKRITLFILGTVCQWRPYRVYFLANKIGINNVLRLLQRFARHLPKRWDIKLLKKLGKKIVYSNNGCLDGVSQTSFSKWGLYSVCNMCRWKNEPSVCSDKRNLAWGKLRNSLADYQCTIGGNRVDYNNDSHIHEEPQFYCLDKNFWRPDLPIPDKFRLTFSKGTVKIFHSVANFKLRTFRNNKNIKCTHIYIPLIKRLKEEGYKVELIFFHNVSNKEVRYYQAQADIVVDMLTFGFFGANIREALMLGKPCICFLRPEWLKSMKKEIPDYVKELPVVSATPKTIYKVLKGLILNPQKREEIGKRSRKFAVKWHSSEAAAKRFDIIYSQLLKLR